MTWPTVHVFAYGEVPTAANINNNFSALAETTPAKVTTKADVSVATGANAIARVPLGSVRYWGLITNPAETTGTKAYPVPTQLDYAHTTYTVANTAAETDTWSYALAAGALGAKEMLEIRFPILYLCNVGSSTWTLKFYIGTTAYTCSIGGNTASATERLLECRINVKPLNATNSQRVIFRVLQYPVLGTSGTPNSIVASADGSDDLSAAKTLKLSVTHGSASNSLSMKVYHPRIIVHAGMT